MIETGNTASGSLLPRTVEPELMDDAVQVEAYATADFADVNARFVDRAFQLLNLPAGARVIDLGCGPGDICIRLNRVRPDLHITGVDGAPGMIRWANDALAAADAGPIDFVVGLLPDCLSQETAGTWDAVISNSLLHHLHDPDVFWSEVKTLLKPKGQVYVVDLMRPPDQPTLESIVEEHAGSQHPVLVRDFRNSLHAAFTVNEVTAQLERHGLDERLVVNPISNRHLEVRSRTSK